MMVLVMLVARDRDCAVEVLLTVFVGFFEIGIAPRLG